MAERNRTRRNTLERRFMRRYGSLTTTVNGSGRRVRCHIGHASVARKSSIHHKYIKRVPNDGVLREAKRVREAVQRVKLALLLADQASWVSMRSGFGASSRSRFQRLS